MRIGELAVATGVSSRSLRYYESLGLIASARTAGGWRDFDAEMVERVVRIQHLFAAGLCSSTISDLLPCLEAPPAERTSHLGRRLAEEVSRLEARKRDLDRQLDVLGALQDEAGSAVE
ncbi:MerR family transcriptional regulator [Nocardioides sp. W7]|uniref:MerR family transcriptional regulator n=1 Tax=Nocardioides sp. W7 TaxID=2931390 RepID=UPI001FD35EA5|nr:MerR family transcriptional regulator [Nocardioides sp. W7]